VAGGGEVRARLVEYRSTYATSRQSLIDYLLAPAGCCRHSVEDVDDERYLEADD
jgi:hypothetical protein